MKRSKPGTSSSLLKMVLVFYVVIPDEEFYNDCETVELEIGEGETEEFVVARTLVRRSYLFRIDIDYARVDCC